jgi:hypothetical protein
MDHQVQQPCEIVGLPKAQPYVATSKELSYVYLRGQVTCRHGIA